jgi:DNA-binding transcriptional regulator YiaG
MTTFATALKDEVRRLARKEIKAQTSSMAKAVAQYRREIARLKRHQRDQERRFAQLANQASKAGVAAPPTPSSEQRFSARSVRAQRQRTGLSAADYAKLVGVSPLTIYNWEHGKSRPRSGQFASLVALRGLGKREAQAKLTQRSAANGEAKAGSRKRRRRS